MKLTEKQKRFADYYIECANATEAYKRAYDCENDVTARTNANKNLQKPTIAQYIEERMKSKEKERIANQDEVLEFLTTVLRGEITERIPIVGKDFFEFADNTPSIKDRTKAAELLGKRYSLFKENINHTGDIDIHITLSDDDDE
jgi:phage terminase small subunit